MTTTNTKTKTKTTKRTPTVTTTKAKATTPAKKTAPVVETKPVARVKAKAKPAAKAPAKTIVKAKPSNEIIRATEPVVVYQYTIIGDTKGRMHGYLSAERQMEAGLRYAERIFIDHFEGTEFVMSLGNGLGGLRFMAGPDGRWGLYYEDGGSSNVLGKMFHILNVDLDLQTVIAGRLQDAWDVGRSAQDTLVSQAASGFASIEDFIHLHGMQGRGGNNRGMRPNKTLPTASA